MVRTRTGDLTQDVPKPLNTHAGKQRMSFAMLLVELPRHLRRL
jgi:hypothetical protein